MTTTTTKLTDAQVKALRTISAEGGNAGVTQGRARKGYVQKVLVTRLVGMGLVEVVDPNRSVGGLFVAGTHRPGGVFVTAAGAVAIRDADAENAAREFPDSFALMSAEGCAILADRLARYTAKRAK